MSVQSEITRLENAKTAIKAAIEGKGVTVPGATLLDGMAPLIDSIEAGGGENPFNGKRYITGTFTLSEARNSVQLYSYDETLELLGTLFSDFVVFWWNNTPIGTTNNCSIYGIGGKKIAGTPTYMMGTSAARGTVIGIGGMYTGGTYIQTNETHPFAAGQEYTWYFVEV